MFSADMYSADLLSVAAQQADPAAHQLREITAPALIERQLCHPIEPGLSAGEQFIQPSLFGTVLKTDLLGKLEAAMHAVIAAEPIDAKVRAAKKAGRLSSHGLDAEYEEAMKLSVITDTELALWKRARVLQHEVIMVDDFDKHFGKQASSAPAVWQQAEAAE